MANTPWMTSSDLIESVKRKISFPIAQNTFTETDILKFANEEMFISQVPSVLQFHEEYFVTYKLVPLKSNVSRYPIPDRATGMKLRDLFWQDQNGNMFDMTRVDEGDRAFFQANIGANQAIHKFFVEGNDVVLTPGVVTSPTGFLVFVFYLRPNQLVKNDRAATITAFNQKIKLNNSLISPLDTVKIGEVYYTAVNSLGGSISAITSYSNTTTLITSVGHQLTSGQTVIITGSNSNPIVDGTYIVNVLDSDTFLIDIQIATSGNSGAFTSPNQFLIAATDILTANNFVQSLGLTGDVISASNSGTDTITLGFADIYSDVSTNNTLGFVIPQSTIGIQFDQLASIYTDQETNVQSPLFLNGVLIDILKTKPGHQTFLYDVLVQANGITGTSIYFNKDQLMVPSGTVNNSASGPASIQTILAPLVLGDYICLANEAIIPQIPPDLHNGLAERTAARLLAAIGDQQGLQASMAKIQEIDQRQGNILDNRSEGNPQKVLNRNSLLRYGKMGQNRRL